jgi:proteasome assembly chaperone (PAC2) family protein
MNASGIHFDQYPDLENPVMIAGFGGWGNALDVAKGMVGYLIRKLGGVAFARVDPDRYFRYDEQRPLVNVSAGQIKSLSSPEGRFFFVKRKSGRDLLLFKGDEPSIQWGRFVAEFFEVAERLEASRLITLGSMYDKVLHTERTLSALASDESHLRELQGVDIRPIDYQGPTAIHAVLQMEAQRRKLPGMSIWAHCPYYLEGTTHFGLLSRLGLALGAMCGFTLDVDELEISWRALRKHIEVQIRENPNMQAMINDIHKARGPIPERQRPSRNPGPKGGGNGNVINFRDFLETDE